MNQMPGTPYPDKLSGIVAEPAFVIGAGDITEWPTNAAMRGYENLLKNNLQWKAYDVLGNHDDGGRAFSPTMLNWSKKRHGGLSYVFRIVWRKVHCPVVQVRSSRQTVSATHERSLELSSGAVGKDDRWTTRNLVHPPLS